MKRTGDHYLSLVLTAAVAGIFSAVVCGLLMIDFARRWKDFPLDLPEYQALRVELAQHPDDEGLRKRVRQLDLQLRREYSRQRRFTFRGAYLLIGGIAVTLISARLAAAVRRKLPMPAGDWPTEDPDAQVSRWGMAAVGGLGVAIAATLVVLGVNMPSPMPASLEDLARLSQPDAKDSAASGRASPTELSYPQPEEIARNWPAFRGPRGDGISAYVNAPLVWDGATGEGIVWKTAVPLPGNNSPIVWEKRVFLTGATADEQEVYCFDAETGALLWKRGIPAGQATDRPKVSEDTGFAAPTAATDGNYVFAIFATGQVCAIDFEGRIVWVTPLGIPRSAYGYAASLATHHGRLIVQFDQGTASDDRSSLIALDNATGGIAWKTPRSMPNSWSSPIVIEHDGEPRIITCGDPWVIAYGAENGTEIWRAKCLRQDVGPSPVASDGMVYVASEFPCVSAIRAGGRGDVTGTHVAWTAEVGLPDTCSPLATDQFLLLLASYGALTCYDKVEGGEPLWEMDFDDSFRASPGLSGNRAFLFGESGKAWVVELNRDGGQIVSEADLGEPCVTSPAFQDGRIFIRGEEHLFCIGNK